MTLLAAVAEGGDAEAVGVVDFLEEDARAFGLFFEGFDGGRDVAFDDVVAEDDGDRAAVGEVFGEAEGVGDAAFPFLISEVEFAEADGFPVAEEFDERAGMLAAGDDKNIGDAGVAQAFDGVHDHRLVEDREEVFVGDFSERTEASAQAAGENDALHCVFLRSQRRNSASRAPVRTRSLREHGLDAPRDDHRRGSSRSATAAGRATGGRGRRAYPAPDSGAPTGGALEPADAAILTPCAARGEGRGGLHRR